MRANLIRLVAAVAALAALAAPAANAAKAPAAPNARVAPAPVCLAGLVVQPDCAPSSPVYVASS